MWHHYSLTIAIRNNRIVDYVASYSLTIAIRNGRIMDYVASYSLTIAIWNNRIMDYVASYSLTIAIRNDRIMDYVAPRVLFFVDHIQLTCSLRSADLLFLSCLAFTLPKLDPVKNLCAPWPFNDTSCTSQSLQHT